MYEEIRHKIIYPRKDHRCEWCAEKIEAKIKCHYRVYVFDGEFMSGWMHNECFEAMGTMACSDLEQGWKVGDFKRGSVECN